MRVNKFLSYIGYCSRREADRLIELGKISVNKKKVVLGYELKISDKLYIEDKFIAEYKEKIDKKEFIIALNKPKGIVSTSSTKDKAMNIVEYVNFHTRVYPVGRLDKDSQGLIFLTNIGNLVNSLMKASSYHEKEYEVEIDKDIDEDFILKMSRGIFLKGLNIKTRKCKVEKISKRKFRIVLTQGLNRQIRRMCLALGAKVIMLKRIRIMNIELADLEYGKYRLLTDKEIDDLKKRLNL